MSNRLIKGNNVVVDYRCKCKELKNYKECPVHGFLKCIKCGKESGDDWTQCGGDCPKKFSPYYKLKTKKLD